MDDKNFYNEASAYKLGWEPSWFNCDDYDYKLVVAIEDFQKKHGLKADGLCGPTTFRRIFTEREAIAEKIADNLQEKRQSCESKQKNYEHIICLDKNVVIEWDKVINLNNKDALLLKPGKLISYKRDIRQFVVHWDAALSSKSCHSILKNRGLSVQFSIDNDGTIYQHTDANDVCWHAKPLNYETIGVEISNAVNLKYQDHYVRKGFGERPIVKCPRINGKVYANEILGFYPVQVKALVALIKSLQTFYDIPNKCPKVNGLHKETEKELCGYQGIVNHYHIDMNKRKWDAACLDLEELLIHL